MRNLIVFVLLSISTMVKGQDSLFIVSGDAKIADGNEVRLTQILPKRLSKFEKTWTAKVFKNKFFFSIYTIGSEVYYLKGPKGGKVLFLSPGRADISVEDSLFSHLSISNNAAATDYEKYRSQLEEISLVTEYGAARVDYDRYVNGQNPDDKISQIKLNKRDSLSIELQKALNSFIVNWIKQNPSSPINSKVLIDLSLNLSFEKLDTIYRSLPEKTKLNRWGKELKYIIDSTMIGGTLPSLHMVDSAGRPFDMRAFKGKYVFLDIWASWCIPCRQENPYIKKLADNYKHKNLEIISLSVDSKKNFWSKAIIEDGLTWKQFIDGEQSNKITTSLYITSIPANFLINKEGKIIARNLFREELLKKISEIVDH